jgi:hypothetical protein
MDEIEIYGHPLHGLEKEFEELDPALSIRYLMGAVDENEQSAVLATAAHSEEEGLRLADVTEIVMALEGLTTPELSSEASLAGLRGDIAREMLDLRTLLQETQDRLRRPNGKTYIQDLLEGARKHAYGFGVACGAIRQLLQQPPSTGFATVRGGAVDFSFRLEGDDLILEVDPALAGSEVEAVYGAADLDAWTVDTTERRIADFRRCVPELIEGQLWVRGA